MERLGRAIVACAPEDREEVLISYLEHAIFGAPVPVKPDRSKANAIFLIGRLELWK